jgi:hypothetical protein
VVVFVRVCCIHLGPRQVVRHQVGQGGPVTLGLLAVIAGPRGAIGRPALLGVATLGLDPRLLGWPFTLLGAALVVPAGYEAVELGFYVFGPRYVHIAPFLIGLSILSAFGEADSPKKAA